MRLILSSMWVLFALTFLPSAHAAGGACSPISREEALKAEDARYAAQLGDDYVTMDKLFSPELVYIHSNAELDSKASFIESMHSGAVKYKAMRRSDVTVRNFGCIAIINGMGNYDVLFKGNDLKVALRFTSIWQKTNDTLQFVSWQSTRIP
ncbi:MAG: nuclear transport factor 2 family protein [Burkholderiales bacterium]|nr:nuclear transport factor 2 family protein [Burkholderiales bacterium]